MSENTVIMCIGLLGLVVVPSTEYGLRLKICYSCLHAFSKLINTIIQKTQCFFNIKLHVGYNIDLK